MKKLCFALIILCGFALSLYADNMKDAYQSYREHKFDKAVELYKEAYKKSEGISHGGQAAMWVGSLYEQGGHGVEKNVNEAITWYKKAIKRNHYFAYGKLGELYSSPKNPTHFEMKKAIDCAEDLIDALPNNFISHRDAAKIYFQVGDIEKAIELQTKAIKYAKNRGVESKKSIKNAELVLKGYKQGEKLGCHRDH